MATYDFEMAYDAGDGYVVLLGGIASSSSEPPTTEMWAFQHGTWSELSPFDLPENCPGSVLAYDDRDGYLVLFEGENEGWWTPGCTAANQTWAYHAGAWTQLHPAVSPPGRYGAAFTNDTADGYLVLFGGISAACAASQYCNDTWVFSGGNWTELFPSPAPSPREEAGFAYDPAIGHPVLFGGSTGVSPFGATDTWEFGGGTWTELFPNASPPWPQPDALSYDAADRELVFTSAWNFSGPQEEVTWVYHDANWTPVTSAGPRQSLGAESSYDYGDGYLLYFSGYGNYGVTNYTWSFVGGTWTPLVAPLGFVATLSVAPAVIDVGLTFLVTTTIAGPTDTYSYSYSGLPTGCASANRAQLICTAAVAGAYSITVSVENSTAQFSNSTASLRVVPYLRVTGLEAFPATVAIGHGTELNTSTTGGVGPLSYLYTHLPPGCTSSDAASLACVPTAQGTFLVIVDVTDSVGAFGTTGVNLTVSAVTTGPAPVVRLFDVAPSTIPLGETSEYRVNATGTAPLSYEYLALPPGCTSASTPDLPCTPSAAGSFVTEVAVSDPLGRMAYANATLNVTPTPAGPGPLSIVEFFASPAVVTVGATTVLEVFVQGGVPPYSYRFAQLPPGCVSGYNSTFPCTPTGAGTFEVSVTVRDAGNGTASASTLLIVSAGSGSPTPGSTPPGASWVDLALGVTAAALAVALAFFLIARRPSSRPPSSGRT